MASSTISPSDVSPRNHGDMFKQIRAYLEFGQAAKTQEWSLWNISSYIHDAQHRIVAIFDRCIGYWMISVGDENEGRHKYNVQWENDRLKGLEGFHPWIGSRLITLKLLLRLDIRAKEVNPGDRNPAMHEFKRLATEAVERLDAIVAAVEAHSNTARAAQLVSNVENELHARLQGTTPCSAYSVIGKMIESGAGASAALTDEQCLAVVMGIVNSFKHRALDNFSRQVRHFRYHTELAITVQALSATVRFEK